MNTELLNADHQILYFIQQCRIQYLDPLFSLFSIVSSYIVIATILVLGGIALYKKSKKLKLIFLQLALIEIFNSLCIALLKNIFKRQRPYLTFDDIQKIGDGGSYSFPSGHTTEVFCFATMFVLAFPKQKSFLWLYAWAAIIGYSRMILGVHYPLDVLGGIFFGVLNAFLFKYLTDTLIFKN